MKRIIVFIGFIYFALNATQAQAGLGFLKVFLAKTHPSCGAAQFAHDPKFCQSFEATARCACTSSGMPASLCQDMSALHERMLLVFSTQAAACEFQRDTTAQNCMDSWKCYRNGGKDSHGHLCQTTGAACQTSKQVAEAKAH